MSDMLRGEPNPAVRLTVLEPESCEGCGVCCEGVGSPVMLYKSMPGVAGPHPFRPADLPVTLIREIDERFAGLNRGEEPQRRCLWFDVDSRTCRHHQWRPQICRDFELGGDACLRDRRRYLVKRDDSEP